MGSNPRRINKMKNTNGGFVSNISLLTGVLVLLADLLIEPIGGVFGAMVAWIPLLGGLLAPILFMLGYLGVIVFTGLLAFIIQAAEKQNIVNAFIVAIIAMMALVIPTPIAGIIFGIIVVYDNIKK
jgi:hypothetical protein